MSLSLLSGIAGTALFVVVFLIDGATRPGYTSTRHAVSALATGPRAWVQTANFLLSGTLIAAAAPGVYLAVGSIWLAAAVGVFGLGLVASGVFPMDPMRGYPPGTPVGTPETTSRRHQRHDWAGAVVFAALPAAAFISVFVLDGVALRIGSGAVAVCLVVLFVRFGTAWENDEPHAGLIQRVMIILGWAWLAFLCGSQLAMV